MSESVVTRRRPLAAEIGAATVRLDRTHKASLRLESAGAAPGIELLCLLDFVLMSPEFPGTNMVKEYEGDHEFEEVEKLDKSFRSLAGHAKTTDFVQIANAFARSMERVASLAALPVELIVWCQAFAQVACIARYEIGP
jgi:hypothetical protein